MLNCNTQSFDMGRNAAVIWKSMSSTWQYESVFSVCCIPHCYTNSSHCHSCWF
ncbi:unnamed protein product [Tenebrio molitor]|nr:unnamed protein product [Tenebrio molitor]